MTSRSEAGSRRTRGRAAALVRDPEHTTPIALTGLRVLFGLLWVQGAGWKVPPDFVSLRNQTINAVENEVFAPWRWVVENVVLEHFSVFGWLTFLAEAGLGALLLVGFCTRASALAGAGLSLVIALSVLNTPGEWGWAYWMLIAGHLVLAALSPRSMYGLDALRASRTDITPAPSLPAPPLPATGADIDDGLGDRAFPIVVLGSTLALAVYGLVASHTVGFTADRGRVILLRNDDWFIGDLVQLNGLGALLYAVVAAVGLAGVWRRSAALIVGAIGGFAVLSLQVLVQFGRDTNWLGSQRGGNLAVCVAAALAVALTPRTVTVPTASTMPTTPGVPDVVGGVGAPGVVGTPPPSARRAGG